MNSFEPVVLQYHSAVSALGSFGVVVVGSVVRTIREVIPIAEALNVVEGVDLHPDNGLEEGLSDECGYFFDGSVSVFDVQINTRWEGGYTMSLTLESLVGGGSSWEEKAYWTRGTVEYTSCLMLLLIMEWLLIFINVLDSINFNISGGQQLAVPIYPPIGKGNAHFILVLAFAAKKHS